MTANVPVIDTTVYVNSFWGLLLLDTIETKRGPEYVDYQFQCDPLDVMVKIVLPYSFLGPLLIDVCAACMATLIHVKVYLQGLASAET